MLGLKKVTHNTSEATYEQHGKFNSYVGTHQRDILVKINRVCNTISLIRFTSLSIFIKSFALNENNFFLPTANVTNVFHVLLTSSNHFDENGTWIKHGFTCYVFKISEAFGFNRALLWSSTQLFCVIPLSLKLLNILNVAKTLHRSQAFLER